MPLLAMSYTLMEYSCCVSKKDIIATLKFPLNLLDQFQWNKDGSKSAEIGKVVNRMILCFSTNAGVSQGSVISHMLLPI